MKRLLIIGALFLAACGGTKTVYVDSTDAPDTTDETTATTEVPVATPAPTIPEPTWTTEDEFILDIELNYPGTIYVPDSDMIDTGYIVCQSLRDGATGPDVIWAIVGAGGDTELITALVGSAVVNFCPEQVWKFENL
jgi:hypothetical protein